MYPINRVPKSGEFHFFYPFSLSLIFAFSLTFWSEATIAKGGIYTLNSFLVISTLYILFILKEKFLKIKDYKQIYIFSVLCGLSLANHHTSLSLFPAYFLFIIFILYESKKFIPSKIFFMCIIFFLIGIAFYLYLPIRASVKPIMNWGNPYNFERTFYHIMRKQYNDIGKLSHSFPLFFNQVYQYLILLIKQLNIFVLLFLPIGIYSLFKKDKTFCSIILLAYILASLGVIYTLNYEITARNLYVNEVFYIPSFMLLIVFITSGFVWIANLVMRIVKNKFALFLSVFVVIFLLFLTFKTNYKNNNMSNHYFGYDYGMNILRSAEKNSIIFTEGDNQMFVLAYLKIIEKRAKDVIIYDDLGVIFENIYGENFLKIPRIERDKIRNRIHREIILKENKKVYFPIVGSKRESLSGFKKNQRGISFEIIKEHAMPQTEEKTWDFWREYNLRGINDEKIYKDYLTRDIIAQYYIALGEYYYSIKDKKKSFEFYELAGKIGYDSEWVSNNLSVIFLEKGFEEAALEKGLKAVEVTPKSPRELSNLATIYYKKGEYEKALEYYNKALEIKSDYVEAYNGIGTVYALQNKLDEAIKFYKKAISIRENFAEAYANIGIVLHMKGKVDEAIEYYNKALTINPNHVEAHSNLGVVYESKGELDKAYNEYKKAIELKPDFADGYYNLGVIYYKRGNYKSAIREWEKTLEINPNYNKAKVNIDRAKKF